MHIFSNVFFFLIRGLPQTDKRSQQKTQRLNFVFVSLEHCQDMYGMRSMSTQLAIALLPFYKCGTTSHATARATKSTTTLQKRSKTKKKQKKLRAFKLNAHQMRGYYFFFTQLLFLVSALLQMACITMAKNRKKKKITKQEAQPTQINIII